MKRALLCLLLILPAAFLSAGEPLRTWTSKNGSEISARYIKDTRYIVYLRTEADRDIKINKRDLSPEDITYLKEVKDPEYIRRKPAVIVPMQNPRKQDLHEALFGTILSAGEMEDPAVRPRIDFAKKETAEYPREYMSQLGIKEYVVVKDFMLGSRERYFDFGYNRAMLISACRTHLDNSDYSAHVFHYSVGYECARVLAEQGVNMEKEFEKINGGKVEYRERDERGYFGLEHPRPGIINGLAGEDIELDIATIYAVLFVPNHYETVSRIAQKDPIIRAKLDAWIGALREFNDIFKDERWKSRWGQ